MRPPSKSAFRLAASALVAFGLLVGAHPAGASSSAQPGFRQNPILFVHGIEGSGAQFESQAMRFMSNGYPKRLDRRGRLQLHACRRRQERSRSADRRGDRGAQAANGQVQGRRDRALTRHLGDVRLPHQRGHGRAAAGERGALHQRRWPGPEPRGADARRMGRQGHTRSAHGRRAERHDPQPDPRADMHLGRVVRRVLQVPDRAAGRTTSSARAGRYEVAGQGARLPAEHRACGRDRPGLAAERRGRRTTAAPLASFAITDGSVGAAPGGP